MSTYLLPLCEDCRSSYEAEGKHVKEVYRGGPDGACVRCRKKGMQKAAVLLAWVGPFAPPHARART